MGIYDNTIQFSDNKLQIIGLVIVALVIIGAIAYFISSAPSPDAQNPLELKFEKNPMKPAETNKATVKITNSSGSDLQNVPIVLFAKEQSEFDIFALNSKFDGKIPVLSNGTTRDIIFVINPVGNVLPGTYVMVAKTTISGKEYEKEALLKVD